MKLTRRLMMVALVVSCLFSSAVFGDVVGKIVVNKQADSAMQEPMEQLVFSSISTKVGENFSPATLSKDIEKLILSGKLSDVKTAIEREADGRLKVMFTVVPKPMVKEIFIKGNEKYTEKRLKNLLKMETDKLLDEVQLAADRKAILDKYRDAGYYGTAVNTTTEKNADGSVNVTFVVHEEKRFKLKKVYFKNNTAFTESELRDVVQTQRQWWRYILRFGNYYNKEMQALDKDKLEKAYGTKGYMDFAVSDILVEPLPDNPKWVTVTFVLQEGSPYTIGDITLEGSKLFSAETLLGKSLSKPGQVHDSDREQADLSLMKAEYERLGYIDLKFYATHKKNTETKIVDVNYHVSEGAPANVRNIDITGNTITKDEVIRRELAIAPGDLADAGKIRITKSRLQNLGYFENVDILPVPTGELGTKDLKIELKEKPTGQLSLGAGFSSEDNAIMFVEFTETNFDLGRLLSMEWPPKGDGQRLRTRVQVGSSVSNISITHTEPWFLDRRLELTTDFFVRHRYEREYDQRNIGGGMMLSWPIAFRVPGTEHIENWRMGIGFRLEHVRVSDVDKHNEYEAMEEGDFIRDHILADEEDSYVANRLIWRVTRDTRNAFLFPTRGSKVTFQSEFVTQALGSYESYNRFDLNATKYIPVFRDFILKLDASYATATGDDVAIFDRYFAGGIGTVRGFKRRDVAPVDCYEDPIGGNSMLTATIELIKPVKNFCYLSTFVDAGNVWWDDFEAKLDDLNYSVGVGVQFKAIPVSIYYGHPIETTYDHLDGKSGRLHFNIGITY